MNLPDIAAIRTDYVRAGLVESDLDPSPTVQIKKWVADAVAAGHPEPTAMALATVSASGEPSNRIVLLKGVDDGLVFFTNYESAKGKDLAANPRAAATLFWVLLERQIRVVGSVTKVTRAESEDYFRSRPYESRIGAWASAQSTVLADRATLEQKVAALKTQYPDDVPLPPFWGGYRLIPDRVELWQGRPSRLHDRLQYTRTPPTWHLTRLSP
ncbi:MAG: pyridoxamine 5'-phosphate oxidase [Labilithrix sp.]|nr:pyridoxamine 5'-phosphate oxidase [Labilithrix sp.]MCW5810545.1 pyridoxamine 5'-phosphate oxidase [Labilithrix sp.]